MPRVLGAVAEKVASLSELDAALARAHDAARTFVVVIDTDPAISTEAGGHWWDVPVAAVSTREQVVTAHAGWVADRAAQRQGD